jgi:hypothetical protein
VTSAPWGASIVARLQMIWTSPVRGLSSAIHVPFTETSPVTTAHGLPARPHDVQLLADLVAGFAGVAPADRGFIEAERLVSQEP